MLSDKGSTMINNSPQEFPMHYLEYLEDLGIDFGKVKVAIETGSHRGGGSLTFGLVFEKVYSIELSDMLYNYCKETHHEDSIDFMHGASTDLLTELVNKINSDYFLFLDAHGSGGDTTFDERVGRYGSPVLDELESVKNNPPALIAVDDLYCFDDPSLNYPSRDQIIEKVNELGNYSDPIVYDFKGERPQWFCFKRIDA